ncbi:MAG: hypothetical protein BWK73_34415 [Thiothrix lacustris]|uniref:HPt domain-containing protein n=1 Tax=Thiothrix lacustris TaxID=525917 RepID=A0A1Y1QGM6_9GAMM|nr:MAG: hypothetical protein BWK73_34415 [Thiothrix lacustris]
MTPNILFGQLIAILGKEATRRFLKVAQPELQYAQQMLLANLQQQNYPAAALIAHKLSATAHLYDFAALQDALATIKAQDAAALQHPAFIPTFMHTFQQIQANIQQFTADNC